jgi:hypothetical protein
MLFRVNVPLDPLIEVKVPTAYMTPPQSATWRIVSVVPVAASVGVPATGVGDTGPVAASAGAAGRHRALAAMPAISTLLAPSLRRRWACSPCCIIPPVRDMGGSRGL